MKKVTIKVEGISCAMCAKTIEGTFENILGAEAYVNVSSSKVTLKYDETKYTVTKLAKYIEQAGYEPILEDDNEVVLKRLRKKKRTIIASIILTIPLLWPMWHHFNIHFVYVPSILSNPIFQLILTTPIQFIIGFPFLKGAYKSIKSKVLGMDVLVAVGTLSAYIFSIYQFSRGIQTVYFEISGTIITIVLLGKYLEDKAKAKTQESIKNLVGLSAKEANTIKDGEVVKVAIEDVKIDDVLVVKQGEKIPVDGVVVEGISHVDESMINGEPIPRLKEVDSTLIGGTINVDATLKMIATKVGEDTLLSQIIKTVEEAQLSKPEIHRIADKIANYFVPTVILISITTFLVWYFFIGISLDQAFTNAVAVLVISCPCALGLATPTSIMVGSGKAAKAGILYKGGEFFEKANKIEAICLDKTGTITYGKPVVDEFIGNIEVLIYANAIESHSIHPIAKAVCNYAKSKKVQNIEIKNYESIIGKGMSGEYEDKKILIGSFKYLNELNIKVTKYEDKYNEFTSVGKTVIFIVVNNKVEALIAIFDRIKENAKTEIERLHKLGVETFMITGDHQNAAKYIANEVGIKNVYADVLPNEKYAYVKKIQDSGKFVAFVGDGINDAPALKQADIGISMGSGTDVAINSSDITLINDDLSLIIKAIRMSKYTLINIYQNFFWAFSYNIIAIPLSASGRLSPIVASIAMGFSSVMVVLNALRLKYVDLNKNK